MGSESRSGSPKLGKSVFSFSSPSTDFNAVIRCSLIYTTLEKCKYDIINHYNALSYVWGDQNNRSMIYVDDRAFSITALLDCALRHIRDRENVMRFWADGICIDQSSVEDRNRQVIQMGDIYSMAQHTIIFLGEGFPEMDYVFEIMALGQPFQFKTDPEDPVSFYKKLEEFREILKSSILSRPWFRRIWVFQELVLSPNPWIQCGKKRVTWDSFCHSLVNQSHPSDPNMRLLIDMWNTRLQHIREKNTIFGYKAAPAQNLLQIMSSRRGLGVSDPRDMVFAHLGLTGVDREILYEAAKESNTSYSVPLLKVDYGKSFEQVCTEVTTYLMHSIPASEMLLHVEDPARRIRREGLLSWVLDWTVEWKQKYEIPNSEEEERKRKTAEAGTLSKLPSSCANSLVVPGVLAAIGMRRGIVNALVSRPDLDWDRKAEWEEQENQLLRWMTNSADQDEVQTILDTVLAYHKTVLSLGYSDDFFRSKEKMFRYPPNETLYRHFEPMITELRYASPLDGNDEQFKRNIVRVLINNLLILIGAVKINSWPGTYQIALLDSREYIVVSLSTQVGDVVCSFPGTVPLGYLQESGRPFGLDIVGTANSEAVILGVMNAWEAADPQGSRLHLAYVTRSGGIMCQRLKYN